MRVIKSDRKFKRTITAGVVLVALFAVLAGEKPATAQDAYTPKFTADKQLMLPTTPVWREWPFIGSLVTPNALNDGNAPFPEHHMIYVTISWPRLLTHALNR